MYSISPLAQIPLQYLHPASSTTIDVCTTNEMKLHTHTQSPFLSWLFSLAELAGQNEWALTDKSRANWSNGLTFPPWQHRIYNLTYTHWSISLRTYTRAHKHTGKVIYDNEQWQCCKAGSQRGEEPSTMKPSRALAWFKWRWVMQHTQQSVRANTQTQKPQQHTYYIFNTNQHRGMSWRRRNESGLFMKHEMRLRYTGEWIRIVSWQESEYVCQFGSCWVCFCPRLVPAVARVFVCVCVCLWAYVCVI